ncbi:MAG: hypothetical protein JGK21_24825 [Microcoleus sp. PH2017_22_RUC_O_B]|uniref:hypothetical protein n=1 Tax=unclassified Microcoleus TaxID=2642155 RepID=UPI001DE096DA|nr:MULTISPECIES: hypothetical protein [unclassified Microcoleus]MCC3531197.1 hypothetical protein [Microcoleus sp. PH2017_21_RUC_O_A]MCC3543514.1 hypothetical protein [Microcoleus sp. PH2017_22_RUC_O_B]
MKNRTPSTTSRLISDCQRHLKDNFDRLQMQECFEIIKEAKRKGFLGSQRERSACFANAVNLANDILRVCSGGRELPPEMKGNPQALYIYVGLVAVNLIK